MRSKYSVLWVLAFSELRAQSPEPRAQSSEPTAMIYGGGLAKSLGSFFLGGGWWF